MKIIKSTNRRLTSIAPNTEVMICGGVDGDLPEGVMWGGRGGGGNYRNYRLTRVGFVGAFLLLYLYVCMSGIFDVVGISAKLSIQVNVILQL